MPAVPADVVRRYFDALGRRDVAAVRTFWAPDGVGEVVGQATFRGPDGAGAYFGGLFAAVPDFAIALDDVIADGDRVAARWHAAGTFGGDAPYQGIAPTGARIALRGADVLEVRDGRIVSNVAFPDGLGFARQLGLMPEQGTGGERALLGAFNARTRAARALAGSGAEPVADGVWRVRGGVPRRMNVYLLEDEGGGVTAFDAGSASMAGAIAAAAARLGGLNRVVLSHAHVDHRGSAPRLDAPVYVHADDRADAEGDGGTHYVDYAKLRPYARLAYPYLMRMWDGGPVRIAGTIAEGEDVSGFRAVHIPGHAPGMIALYRERDGLALSTDCFYVLDAQTGRLGPPRVPLDAFNLDTEQARDSIRKLAALRPSAAWPGHGEPLTGDVAAQLERAAAAR